MTLLGFHVATGSRNGYGPAAQAGPALVVAVGEAGAFDELPDETRKVYRDLTLWGNTPQGYQQMSGTEIRNNVLTGWGPYLEARYEPIASRYQNVWFGVTNEMAGNTPYEHHKNAYLVSQFLDYFTAKGFPLCIFNFSGGDPGLDDWSEYYLPVIEYAAGLGAGHAYGRHVYGGVPEGSHNMLTLDGEAHSDNTRRPFVEADAIFDMGLQIPIFLTEAGQNGGYLFPGVPAFMNDVRAFDRLCYHHPNIGGFALWTYGNYQNRPANIEAASAAMASYLAEKEISEIVLPPIVEPKHKAIVVKAPQEVSTEDWLQIADYAFDFKHTMTPSHNDMITILQGGNDQSFVKIVRPDEPSQVESIDAIIEAGYTWVDVTDQIFEPPPPEPEPEPQTIDVLDFMFPVLPKQYIVRNQATGAQERYYPHNYEGGYIIQKGSQGEHYTFDNRFIYLVWDTTPGGGRYYVRSKTKDDSSWAPYCPRYLRIGRLWSDAGHYVQFYHANDCSPSSLNSGQARQEAIITTHYPSFVTPEGAEVGETIKLVTGSESHYFAKGWGRIGWASPWGEAWKTPEDVTGQQPEELRLPPCL